MQGVGLGVVPAGKPFYPEVLFQGSYYPVCADGFSDNDFGASEACLALGLPFNGTVVATDVVFESRNAMPIGACMAGESLNSCSGGENAWGDFDFNNGACTAGKAVGVQLICNTGESCIP